MEYLIGCVRNLVCLPIKGYQYLVSPLFFNCCRFEPSCSHYALLSIKHHGVIKGLLLTCYRLGRCHPWAKGGYDPVLPIKEKL